MRQAGSKYFENPMLQTKLDCLRLLCLPLHTPLSRTDVESSTNINIVEYFGPNQIVYHELKNNAHPSEPRKSLELHPISWSLTETLTEDEAILYASHDVINFIKFRPRRCEVSTSKKLSLVFYSKAITNGLSNACNLIHAKTFVLQSTLPSSSLSHRSYFFVPALFTITDDDTRTSQLLLLEVPTEFQPLVFQQLNSVKTASLTWNNFKFVNLDESVRRLPHVELNTGISILTTKTGEQKSRYLFERCSHPKFLTQNKSYPYSIKTNWTADFSYPPQSDSKTMAQLISDHSLPLLNIPYVVLCDPDSNEHKYNFPHTWAFAVHWIYSSPSICHHDQGVDESVSGRIFVEAP